MQSVASAIDEGWTQLLDNVAKILIPDWNFVISLLPGLLLLGLLGPLFTLLGFRWLAHLASRKRGRVARALAGGAARLDAGGAPVVPPNMAYCPTDRLVYAGNAVQCTVCRQELQVTCPVDGTVRPASEHLCRACGTRYVLGAAMPALTVQRRQAPPPGGAAIA